jgi:DNA polymerase V
MSTEFDSHLTTALCVPIPFIDGSVPAGFPSPADDFAVKRHDLNELLITHPLATFMWRAAGESMIEFGIRDGDILVCNRALRAVHGHIVIAQVNGSFTIKKLFVRGDRVKLVPGNPTYPEITFKSFDELIVCGVVTASITVHVKSARW